MRTIDLIGANFGLGGAVVGSEFAPQRLRSLGVFQRVKQSGVPLIDCGDVLQNPTHRGSPTLTHGVYNLQEVVGFCSKLKSRVAQSYRNDHLALIVGGDHSIALGSLSATLDFDPDAAVIWFDAHTDINTEASSPSHNAHGMPMAAMLNLCQSKLTTLATTPIKSNHIFYLGVRDIDRGEQEILQQYPIHAYTMRTIQQQGMASVLQQISSQLNQLQVKTIHLSFDIDGMDPTLVSATGTPVANGFTEADFDMFCNWLPLDRIRALDFVEYNPLLDNNNATAFWCCSAIRKMLLK